jgi:tetratricopeptide (TPR) repeat protein
MLRNSWALLLILLPGTLFAQQKNVKFTSSNFKDNPSGLAFAQQKLRQGDEHLQLSEYEFALGFFLSADSVNPNNADLNVKIGLCYLNSIIKSRSLRYFQKALSLDKKISPRMPYFLGRGYHLNCQWDSAIAQYQLYLKKANAKEKVEINKYLEECNNGKELAQHAVTAKLENLGPNINSEFKEHSPVLTADEKEIIFTSKRTTVNGEVDPTTGEYLEQIYVSYYKDGEWTPAANLGNVINKADENNATSYLSPNGQSLYICRDENNGDIYVTHYNAGNWTEPQPLDGKINTQYHESSVALSPDGKTLYFVSDRPGGKGGNDIYKSTLQADSSWGDPVNLGDTINTQYDEEGVFMHPDGKTLFFSSKGHNTMGGFDIFKSVFENGHWSVPENLGYPINTPDDDVFFVVSATGEHGYFASAKDSGGYGSLDIYRVSMESFKPRLLVLKGLVIDSATRKPLNATITVNNRTKNVSTPYTTAENTGEYLISLASGNDFEIKVHSEGYPDAALYISVYDTATYHEVVKNIALLIPGTGIPVAGKDTSKNANTGNATNTASSKMADSCKQDIYTLMRTFNGLTADTNVLHNMLNHMDGSICLKNLKFTVQIGAYHFPRNFKYKNVELKPIAINGFPDGITRFTMGLYKTYHEAKQLKKAVVAKGIKDAFIVGLYNGKRIILDQLVHPK